jgi:hypothetical protein
MISFSVVAAHIKRIEVDPSIHPSAQLVTQIQIYQTAGVRPKSKRILEYMS